MAKFFGGTQRKSLAKLKQDNEENIRKDQANYKRKSRAKLKEENEEKVRKDQANYQKKSMAKLKEEMERKRLESISSGKSELDKTDLKLLFSQKW